MFALVAGAEPLKQLFGVYPQATKLYCFSFGWDGQSSTDLGFRLRLNEGAATDS